MAVSSDFATLCSFFFEKLFYRKAALRCKMGTTEVY